MNETSKASAGHIAGFTIALTFIWLGWSGHLEPMILGFGVLSLFLTIWVSKRLGAVDDEAQPVNPRLIGYAPWLIKEIIVANIDVIKRILSPNIDQAISPTWIMVSAKQKTRLGRVIFANSITLTPGTVSVEVGDDKILVHALSKEGAESLAGDMGGDMGTRVCGLEG